MWNKEIKILTRTSFDFHDNNIFRFDNNKFFIWKTNLININKIY